MKTLICCFCLFLQMQSFMAIAQDRDTVLITPKTIKVQQLKEGKSKYLVYFTRGESAPASEMQLWNIAVKRELYNGKEAIIIDQHWDSKDTIIHSAKSISTIEDFSPLYHESWWKMRDKRIFDVQRRSLLINGTGVTLSDTISQKRSVYQSFLSSQNQYFLNWHLDLVVFAMLPYRKNVTFLIPFYEFGYDVPKKIAYSVVGEVDLEIVNGTKIKCWLLKHEEKDNTEIFWISKSSPEVMRLEQKFRNIYRYKIRLPL